MAVITPILDTLLHDVLGKRMDGLPRRDMAEAVRPVNPQDGPPALRSDSRLDPRRPPVEGAGRFEKPSADRGAAQPGQQRPLSGPGSPAVETRLSPAARVIREVLARFPAPPSVLRSPAPLLPGGDTALAPATDRLTEQVRERLQRSIRDSGLFYESHLREWFRGRRSAQELSREPQMRLAPPRSAGAGESVRAGTPAAAQSSDVPQGGGDPKPAAEASSRTPPAGGEAGEKLQALVRHQLELLAHPVLRWEGDVWSGLFMSLLICPPHVQEDASRGQEKAEAGAEEWRSELALDVDGVGRIGVMFSLAEQRLALTLTAPTQAVLALLEGGRESLAKRLAGLGYSPVLSMVCQEEDGV